VINGNCSIGEYTYIGSNSCIKENVKVGERVIVAMCAAVYKDVPDDVIIVGNPARISKLNEKKRVF